MDGGTGNDTLRVGHGETIGTPLTGKTTISTAVPVTIGLFTIKTLTHPQRIKCYFLVQAFSRISCGRSVEGIM